MILKINATQKFAGLCRAARRWYVSNDRYPAMWEGREIRHREVIAYLFNRDGFKDTSLHPIDRIKCLAQIMDRFPELSEKCCDEIGYLAFKNNIKIRIEIEK